MTAVVEQPLSAAGDGIRKKRWTREEVAILERHGVFDGEHWELIEGELISRMGKTWRHTAALVALRMAMRRIFDEAQVITEPAIYVHPQDTPSNEPEPDLIIARASAFSLARNPGPPDILLLVEVSDTTLRHDRTTKARLYARAGIADYWVMDVSSRRLFIHRSPAGDRYENVVEYTEDESVSPLAAPGHAILISDLFGPALPLDAE